MESDFQLIAGTNRDLTACVAQGSFRDDLYACLNLWTFSLPGLADRRKDIAPNLDYELDRRAEREGDRETFNKETRENIDGWLPRVSAGKHPVSRARREAVSDQFELSSPTSPTCRCAISGR